MLRRPVMDDSDLYFEWINNRELVNLSSPFKAISRADHNEWFASLEKRSDMSVFSICENSYKSVIGSCSLRNLNDSRDCGELQIRIGDSAQWGKGYGKQAASLLVEYGFLKLDLKQVDLQVFETNVRAIRAYKAIGFKVDGVLENGVRIEGELLNIITMSINRCES